MFHILFPSLHWVIRKHGCREENIPRMCCIISVVVGSRITRCVILPSDKMNLTLPFRLDECMALCSSFHDY